MVLEPKRVEEVEMSVWQEAMNYIASEEDRQTFIVEQEATCARLHAPFFMPRNSCWHCGKDVVSVLIALGKDGSDLVTGCPYCMRSYCD